MENPADWAYRGLFPSELLKHELWWKCPPWLLLLLSECPKQSILPPPEPSDEERNICRLTTFQPRLPIIPLNHYSSFTKLKCEAAWMFRFINNCRVLERNQVRAIQKYPSLSVQELVADENYWSSISQQDHFKEKVHALNKALPSKSCLLSLDSSGILRISGRAHNSKLSYSNLHHVILHGKHPVTKLIIRTEHLRSLHAGPTLLTSSLRRCCTSLVVAKLFALLLRLSEASASDDGTTSY